MFQPYSAAAYGMSSMESNNYSQHHGDDETPNGWAGALHPDNPLLWVAGLLAVTFGLIGISGGVRVGKARAAVEIDRS